MTLIYIAHRGNTNGPNPKLENSPDYIDAAIAQGFHVELDVWWKDGQLYLGHDEPQYKTSIKFLLERAKVLWIHCKNLEALDVLMNYKSLNLFVHDKDMATLTSHNYVWTYPGCKFYPKNSICVMPEWESLDLVVTNSDSESKDTYIGVCSDFVTSISKN
jgi:glycerophosphoryl diester phosphodiesterase